MHNQPAGRLRRRVGFGAGMTAATSMRPASRLSGEAAANLRRSLLMLMPGGLAIIATAGIATGHIGKLSVSDSNSFFLFLLMELLAVGVGRLGFDQLVLSRASTFEEPDLLGFTPMLFRVILPLTAGVAGVLGLIIGGPAGLAVFIAAPIDVMSTVTGSFELGRRRYATNIAFAWLNYPVFLLFLVAPGIHVDTSSLTAILVLFCSTSLLRGAVSVVLLAAHRRRQVEARHSRTLTVLTARDKWVVADRSHDLTPRDLVGSGTVSVCQAFLQRPDVLVLALFGSQFPKAAIASYFVANRLLDASYTVSAVAGSLMQVSVDKSARRSWRDRRVLQLAVVWSALWVVAALALLVLQWPHPLRGWGRIALAVPGAVLYLSIFRHVLTELAAGRSHAIARRFGGYLLIAVVAAAVAVVTGEPAVMFIPAAVNGLASTIALARASDS